MVIDSRDLRLLAVQGLTMAEIARELKQPYFRVRKSCQLYGVDVPWDVPGKPTKVKAPKAPRMPKAPKPPRVNPNAERNAQMVTMYRQGLTLEKIGQNHGMTRERVRQIIKKLGVRRVDGGQAKTKQSKEKAKLAKKDAHYLTRHGLTFAEYKEARAMRVIGAYRSQEKSAAARGIEWGLNLAQWLEIWKTSGKLDLRGRGKGKYLMSRIKDSGGYETGNVHIQLATQNSREAVEQWRDKPAKKNPGVHLMYPGLSKPYMVKVCKKFLGYYATEEEGVKVRADYIAAHGLTLKSNGSINSRPAACAASPSL